LCQLAETVVANYDFYPEERRGKEKRIEGKGKERKG